MSERPRPGSRPRPVGPAGRPRAEEPAAPGEAPAKAQPPVGRPKGPVGRGIRAADDPAPPPPPPSGTGGTPGELSPFQRFGGAPQAAGTSAETVQVMGMVVGLLMALGAAVVVVLVVVLFAVGAGTGMIDVPGVTPEKRAGLDTDVAIAGPRAAPKPVAPRGKAEGVAEPEGPAPPREVSGTILLDLDPGELFHTVEAKCPSTPDVRRRAEIRGSRVSITLPDNEDCRLTFQGSLPAYGYLRGGQTKTCSFNPTNCRL